MAKDSISRFSRRAKNYDRFRPNYPTELMAFLHQFIASIPDPVLADIAAGTGIFTEQLADWGHTIYVVEPNKAMRNIAVQRLSEYPRCIFADGTAEATGLPDRSVDFILSAQAFHWFDLARTKTEFGRISREHAYVAIVWNLRNTASAFEAAYEALIRTYAVDYLNVSQRRVDTADVLSFFAPVRPAYRVFGHVDFLTFEQLCGRTRSYSFMPDETSMTSAELLDSLATLFDRYQRNGKVRLSYKTRLFIGRLG